MRGAPLSPCVCDMHEVEVGHGVVRIAVAGAEVHAVRRAYQAGSYEATAGVWRLTGASKYSGGSASFQASHWGKPNVQCRSWLPLGWPSRLAPCHMSQPRTVHPRRLKHRITSALGGPFCGTADDRPRDYGPKNQDPDQGQGLDRIRDTGQDCPQAGEEPDDSALVTAWEDEIDIPHKTDRSPPDLISQDLLDPALDGPAPGWPPATGDHPPDSDPVELPAFIKKRTPADDES